MKLLKIEPNPYWYFVMFWQPNFKIRIIRFTDYYCHNYLQTGYLEVGFMYRRENIQDIPF